MKTGNYFILLFILIAATSTKVCSQDISFYYDSTYGINYNRNIGIGFEIKTAKGEHLRTSGYLNGDLKWKDLKFKVTGGKIKDGRLLIGDRNEVPRNNIIVIEVSYPKLSITKTVTLPLPFSGMGIANYKPANPRDVQSRGERIIPRIWIFALPGKTGRRGRNGYRGPDLTVRVSEKQVDGKELVAVVVAVKGAGIDTFYIQPTDHLRIIADGGDGGTGGMGGPGCSGKYTSDGGEGGEGGTGGDGGSVEVEPTQALEKYKHCLIISNAGGRGGAGGTGGQNGTDEKGEVRGGNTATQGSYGIQGKKGPAVFY